MLCAVVNQRNDTVGHTRPIERDNRAAVLDRARFTHIDQVRGCSVAIGDPECRPVARNARLNAKRCPCLLEAKQRLERHAVHPARGSGVPGPPAAADMRWGAVDVGRDHIRFDLVPSNAGRCVGVGERIEHLKQRERPVAVTAHGSRQHRPQRGMRVLSAIFAHTGQIAADVSGIGIVPAERRREQLDQSCVFTHQLLVERFHRQSLSFVGSCA